MLTGQWDVVFRRPLFFRRLVHNSQHRAVGMLNLLPGLKSGQFSMCYHVDVICGIPISI